MSRTLRSRLLADVLTDAGRYEEAERILNVCPNFAPPASLLFE
jgi:hypothetical protein